MALFLPTLGGGGIERLMPVLARGFADHGFETDLLVARAEGPFLDSVPDSVRLVDFHSRMTVSSLPRLIHYLKTERPDVLCAAGNAVIPALIASRLFRSRPLTIARQDTTLSEHLRNGGFKSRLALRLIQLLLPTADAVVVASEGVADDLRRTVPRATRRIQIIPNPVFDKTICELASEPIDHPWFDDGSFPVIVAVGRLAMEKDYPTLLRALTEVVRARPARLIVLGDGPELESLQSLTAELGLSEMVDYVGFVKNPYPYMARSDLFVLSSVYEGLPTALIEAMGCGTCVVSTDCPSGPREILGGGKWGQLVPVGDSSRLSRAILDSLDNPTERNLLIERATAFSVDSSMELHLKLLGVEGSRCA